MSGISQDFSNEQWKAGLPDTIQVSRAEYEALLAAAQAVVDRWNSPDWKDGTHTAEYINRLSAAIAAINMPANGEGARDDPRAREAQLPEKPACPKHETGGGPCYCDHPTEFDIPRFLRKGID
jgi:hypothetical protein